jgi:hypothetical protein
MSETSVMTTMLLLAGLNGSGVTQIIHYLIKLIKYIKISGRFLRLTRLPAQAMLNICQVRPNNLLSLLTTEPEQLCSSTKAGDRTTPTDKTSMIVYSIKDVPDG